MFGPETSQGELFDATSVVDRLTQKDGYNCLFLAYGQTGTGKTHTMLGLISTLESPVFHPDWGLFPRTVHSVLEKIKSRTDATFLVTASAVEFYMGVSWDLLDNHAHLVISEDDNLPLAATRRIIKSDADIMPFLKTLIANRTTGSTAMNKAEGDHEGSSRSHAALMMQVMQMDKATKKVSETTFTLVDLAGAERPGKNGAKRFDPLKDAEEMWRAMASIFGNSGGIRSYKKMKKKTLGVAAQAYLINTELQNFGKEVVSATACHKRGSKYKPPQQMTTDTQRFLGSALNGRSLMCMIVTLSPAGRNGWETWFSLQYGTDLAKLAAPCRPVKASKVAKLIEKHQKIEKEMTAWLAKTPPFGAPGSKYYAKNHCRQRDSQSYIRLLKMISGESSE